MNSLNPLISIIVPVYKVEKYLNCCVESILAQTYNNLEIILIDDGSPDNSPEICDNWAKKDSRIRVIHKENGGAASARNSGIDIAEGEYIGFVDSDDYISKDMYSYILDVAQKNNAKIVCCRSVTFKDGEKIPECIDDNLCDVKLFSASESIDRIFSFKMGTAFWRRLFHKSVFEGIRFPEGEINEEYPLLIPITVKAGGTAFVKKPLYYYRDRADSVTGTLHKSLKTLSCLKNNLILMKKQLDEYQLNDVKNYSFFVAKNALFTVVSILKAHDTIEGDLKKLYDEYFCLVKENKQSLFVSKEASLKEKILLILVLSGLYKTLFLRRRKKGKV